MVDTCKQLLAQLAILFTTATTRARARRALIILPSLTFCIEDILENENEIGAFAYLRCKASDFGAYFVDPLAFKTRLEAALMFSTVLATEVGSGFLTGYTYSLQGVTFFTAPEPYMHVAGGRLNLDLLAPRILTLAEAKEVYKLSMEYLKLNSRKVDALFGSWCFIEFEEVTAIAVKRVMHFGPNVVNKRIKVWWPLDKAWYQGVVELFNPESCQHTVLYDDGEREVLDLPSEQV